MKVQAHNSLEPPLEYKQDETSFMTFLTILGANDLMILWAYDLFNHIGMLFDSCLILVLCFLKWPLAI